jgi:nitrogen regulatory protein P-II 1
MVKVEYVLSPDKLADVKEAMQDMGVHGMTITEVTGTGLTVYGGRSFNMEFNQGLKIEIVVRDYMLERVVKGIIQTVSREETGDGRIIISAVSDAVRISTEERGESAV